MATATRVEPITRQQQKIMTAAELIRTTPPPDEKSITYMARPLVQATLPHSDPGDVPEWTRKNGGLTLAIRPGWMEDTTTGVRRSVGYPYGTVPRLIMFWMVKEATQKKSRRLKLGDSLTDFMSEIGLSPDNGTGQRSDIFRLRDQAERLFQATISFEQTTNYGTKTRRGWLNMQVASDGVMWWDSQKDILSGSWIELSEKFFEAIIAAPVPVDMRALAVLKNSSMSLDLYSLLTFLSFQASKIGEERFLTWEQLQCQLGTGYARIDHVKENILETLDKIVAVYPGLRLGNCANGIEVLPESKTCIPIRSLRRLIPATDGDHQSPRPPAQLQSESIPSTPLPELSVEVWRSFRGRYPRLDINQCQEDFEQWLASGSKKRPTYYGRAFLGFAQKWAAGKG